MGQARGGVWGGDGGQSYSAARCCAGRHVFYNALLGIVTEGSCKRASHFQSHLKIFSSCGLLGEQAAEKAREGRLSRKELSSVTRGMLELSDRFNGIDATPLGDYMKSRRHRAGYFLYFLPANFAKAWAVASEMSPTLSDKQEISILDVGSGPGSLALGISRLCGEADAGCRGCG